MQFVKFLINDVSTVNVRVHYIEKVEDRSERFGTEDRMHLNKSYGSIRFKTST